MKDRRKI